MLIKDACSHSDVGFVFTRITHFQDNKGAKLSTFKCMFTKQAEYRS